MLTTAERLERSVRLLLVPADNVFDATVAAITRLHASDVFVGESTYPGRIFKVALDGTVLGVIGRAGRNLGQFSGAHALACPSERELYVAETSNWRVQKLLLQ